MAASALRGTRALQAAWRRDIEAATGRSCPRPVLRGAPVRTPAAPDLLRLTEPDGAIASCLALADGAAVMNALEDRSGAVWTARALGDVLSATPETAAIEGACGSLPAAIEQAVRHEDACSPYFPGVRALVPARVARLSRAAAVLARARARTGDRSGALELLFDSIRVEQDLVRGGADFITATAVARARGVLVQHVVVIANELDAPALAALEPMAAALIASEPALAADLAAERVAVPLVVAARIVLDYTPPSGWPADVDRSQPENDIARAAIAESWASMDGLLRAAADACAAQSSRTECVGTLALMAMPPDSPAPATLQGRDAVMRAQAAAGYYQVAEKLVELTAPVAALQLYLQVRQDALATETCPPAHIDVYRRVIPAGWAGFFTLQGAEGALVISGTPSVRVPCGRGAATR